MLARMRSAIDGEASATSAIAAQRRAGGLHHRGERGHFGLPAADAALVFLHHAREECRDQPGQRAPRRRARSAQPAGFRLCGIVDEPPPGSDASPTSSCISSETSRAILPSAPV